MSAKKTSAKTTKAKAAVKAKAPRTTRAKKTAKTVVVAKRKPAKSPISAEKMKNVFTGKSKAAKLIHGVDETLLPVAQPVHNARIVKAVGKGKRVVPKSEAEAAVAPANPVAFLLQQEDPPVHTMQRSYIRSTGIGQGKLRGSNYQCTVSFTQDQMNQVRAAAQFRNVSLAELIRSCTVAHLNAAPNDPA